MSTRGNIGRQAASLGDGRLDVRPSRCARAETCVWASVSTTGKGMILAPKVVLRGLEVLPTVITCVPYPPEHGTPARIAADHRLIDRAPENVKNVEISRVRCFSKYPTLRPCHSTTTTIHVANKASIVLYASSCTPHVPRFCRYDPNSSRTSARRPGASLVLGI